MTVRAYLQEEGSGAFRDFRVPDVVHLASTAIEVLILLESPHIDELARGLPISGQAGMDALRFLKSAVSTSEALGPFVESIHAKGDGRVAIMNVSEVPLQANAFAHQASSPGLARADWDLLERVRDRKAKRVDEIRDVKTRDTSALLSPGLKARLGALCLAPGATVVPAGGFAQRYWNSISLVPIVTVLPVLHPSRRLWDQASGQHLQNLLELRKRFAMHTS